MPELANINGKICPISEAVVPAEDRGYLFGDGVYEVIRCYGGRPWALERHMQRLERSLKEIELNNVDLAQVRRWIHDTYEQSQIPEATVYFHLTRGVAPRSHVWGDDLAPTFFMTVRAFAARGEGSEKGIRAISVPDQRWSRCDIKSLNLLPNVLAKQKARSEGCYEAIFVDDHRHIREGTSSAVLCVIGGVLSVHPNTTAVLPSITRQFVFEIAADLKIPLEEKPISLADFYAAEEAFLAGTGDELMGITHLDNRPIGEGKVGKITRRIYQEYRERISRNRDAPC